MGNRKPIPSESRYVYVTWSDGRDATPPDATNGIFARLPLADFLPAR